MGNVCRRDLQLQPSPHSHSHHGQPQKTPRTPKHFATEEEFLAHMERERKEGRVLLRQMVVKSDEDDAIDWKAVIHQAETLHRTEQTKIQKRQKQQKRKKSPRRCRGRGKKQATTKKLRDQPAPYNQVGSFSVNLLTMRPADDDSKAVLRWRKRRQQSRHHHRRQPHHLQNGDILTSSATSSSGDQDDEAGTGIVNASGSNDTGFDTSSIVVAPAKNAK